MRFGGAYVSNVDSIRWFILFYYHLFFFPPFLMLWSWFPYSRLWICWLFFPLLMLWSWFPSLLCVFFKTLDLLTSRLRFQVVVFEPLLSFVFFVFCIPLEISFWRENVFQIIPFVTRNRENLTIWVWKNKKNIKRLFGSLVGVKIFKLKFIDFLKINYNFYWLFNKSQKFSKKKIQLNWS